MAFGALVAYAFNGPLGLGMLPATVLAMLATAALFLASIGLALVLRQSLLLAAGPQPRAFDVNPYRVYVIGSVRLSEAQLITILVAAGAIVAIGVFLARTTLGRTMRAMADDRALA